MMQPILFVTGADARYFSVAAPLLFSFQLFCPESKLYFCDYGLTAAQKRFLAHLGVLLPWPENLPEGLHPYAYKASMEFYVKNRPFETLFWIDADCLVTGPLDKAVYALYAQMPEGDFLATCADRVGRVETFLERHRHEVKPFLPLLKQYPLEDKQSYLNCATFLLRSQKFLPLWRELTWGVKPHLVFEQNIFNILARNHIDHVIELDSEVWNAHDQTLDQLEVDLADSKLTVRCGEKVCWVVHPTSFQGERIEAVIVEEPLMEGMIWEGLWKSARNPQLKELSRAFLKGFLDKYATDLLRFGVLSRSSP
ncbi:hypothetical protein ACQZV8_05135 [Magnetococcales bacterium HHB-1]